MLGCATWIHPTSDVTPYAYDMKTSNCGSALPRSEKTNSAGPQDPYVILGAQSCVDSVIQVAGCS